MKRLGLLLLLCLPLRLAADSDVAPAFNVQDLSGTAWTQAGPPKGVMLLDFWANWCAPCVLEIPSLNALQAKYGPSHKLSVLGLCMDKGGLQAIQSIVDKRKIQYAVAPGDPKLAKAYAVEGFPTAFVVKDGKVLLTLTGKHSLADFEKALAPYLK